MTTNAVTSGGDIPLVSGTSVTVVLATTTELITIPNGCNFLLVYNFANARPWGVGLFNNDKIEEQEDLLKGLEDKVNENVDGETTVEKDFVWSVGYVNDARELKTSTSSKFCQPILFKAGEVLYYKTGTQYGSAVVKVADDTPLSIGATNFVVSTLICAVPANNVFVHSFDEDTYVVISVKASDYSITVKKKALPLVKYSGYAGIPIGTNILTPDLINRGNYYFRKQDGITYQSGGFGVTDFIEIPPEGLCGYGMATLSGSYSCPGVLYDADKRYAGFINNTACTVLPSSSYKYVRFNLGNPANLPTGADYAVFTGTKKQDYSSPVKSCIINGGIIKEGSIELSKLADTNSKNLVKRVWNGYYYNPTDGSYLSNNSYTTTDRIPVTPGTDYVANNSIRNIYLFDTDGYLSRTITSMAFTTESDEVMVIVEFLTRSDAQYMLEEGTAASEYAPYKLQLNEDIIPYKELPDGSVTRSKIAPEVSLPSTPNPFNSFVSTGEIATGETITAPSILISNRQVLSAEIIGTIEDVLVGVGNGNLYGCWLQITPTQVKVVYGSSSTVAATYSHGLTLGTRTKVIIERGSELSFHIVNDAGGMYSNAIRNFIGTPFIKNNGVSSISASLRYGSRIASARIWCAGDSYWSFNDQARIPYNLSALGASEILVVARGGESAGGILPSLQALVESGGRPSYIVWALGMNGGTDSNGQVNTNWLNAVNTFLSMCSDAGITPVFCTVPTVPSASHDAMNAWIRNSGYRYIDVAEEVEQSGTNTWRGWGTDDALLSSDQVHPSHAGALQIASRIIVEFPEITQLNP